MNLEPLKGKVLPSRTPERRSILDAKRSGDVIPLEVEVPWNRWPQAMPG